MSLVGPFLAACLLLVLAGVMKALRPADTARALRRLVPVVPLRGITIGVRLLAAAEAALGAVAMVLPRPAPVAAVAGSYLVFGFVVAYARIRGGALASCGCFGTPDTPASWLHVVVDLFLAASAAVVAAAGPRQRAFGEFAGQPLHGVLILLSAMLGSWLVFLALGPAARLAATPTGAGRHVSPVRDPVSHGAGRDAEGVEG